MNLKELIESKGFKSLRDFARQSKIASTTLSDIASGRTSPNRSSKEKIASALGMKVEEVFPVKESTSNISSLSNNSYVTLEEHKELKSKVEDLEKKLDSMEYLLKNILSK